MANHLAYLRGLHTRSKHRIWPKFGGYLSAGTRARVDHVLAEALRQGVRLDMSDLVEHALIRWLDEYEPLIEAPPQPAPDAGEPSPGTQA